MIYRCGRCAMYSDACACERPLVDALERIEIVNPPFPVQLAAVADGRVLAVTVATKERDTGKSNMFTHHFSVPEFAHGLLAYGPNSPSLMLRWIADRVRAVFIHEFHECFRVDERRMFEPHPDAEPGQTTDARPLYDFGIGPSDPPRSRF